MGSPIDLFLLGAALSAVSEKLHVMGGHLKSGLLQHLLLQPMEGALVQGDEPVASEAHQIMAVGIATQFIADLVVGQAMAYHLMPVGHGL